MTIQDTPLHVALDASFLSLPASGIGSYVTGLSTALMRDQDALGLKIALVTPGDGRLLTPGSRQHRFAWDALGVAAGTLRQAQGADVLHLPQMSAPLWSPAPMVVTIHDVIPLVLPDYRASRAMRLYLGLMARTAKRARIVIAPSESARADISRVLDIGLDRILVIPEAADPTLAPATGNAPARLVADRWGLAGPYLFNIGGYDRRKNLPLTVEAFAAALPHLPANAKLVIGGAPHSDNPLVFPSLDPIINEHGLQGRVVLTGRVSDAERRALYQAATGYVTASSYEGFGLTPLEAMACGVPVIVANRTSLPEVVGDAGIVIEPTKDDLAAAMVAVLTDSDLRADLARAGLERAAQFSWDVAATETAAAYHSASRTQATGSLRPLAG